MLLGPGGSRVHSSGEVEEWGMGSMDIVSVDHLPNGAEVGGDVWYETKEHCEAGLAHAVVRPIEPCHPFTAGGLAHAVVRL